MTPARNMLDRALSVVPFRLSALTLWQQLTLIVLVTASPLLLAVYFSFARLAANEQTATEVSLMQTSKILAALVDNEIDTHYVVARSICRSHALARGDLQQFWTEAREGLEMLPGAWLVVNDSKGQPLLSTLAPYGSPLPPRADPDSLLQSVQDKGGRISDLRRSAVTDRLVAFIDIPIFESGSLKYIVSISLLPQRFFMLLKSRFGEGELVGILDRSGRFIARIPDNDARLGTLASEGWRASIANAAEGMSYVRSLEGHLTVNAYTTSARGWIVGIARLRSALDKPRSKVLDSLLWTVSSLAIISLFSAALIARHAGNGMKQLAEAASGLGQGQRPPPLSPPFQEAASICDALKEASEQIAQNNAELESRVSARTQELSAEMQRREQSEAQARQLLRMQAVGQLTGGIAHDFNNMLAIVISSLNLVKRRLAAGRTDIDDLISGGLDGAQRGAALTQRLLAFSRQQPLSPQTLDINKLVSSLAVLIPRTIGEHIRVETVLAAGLWKVLADASELENAIVNLAVNARDAMPEGGKLTIETSNHMLDEAYSRENADVAAGQFVQIAVTDTGCGMSRDEVARAFEPFYTTKAPGAGTGLGLSQVYGFVKQSHGHAKIYSEPGHGTSVKIYLPRYVGDQDAAVSRTVNETRVERSVSGELILIVEDEARVRTLTAETLRELGYQVLEADGASAALAHLNKVPDIKLLFTDIVMPEMNGRKLADLAQSINPNLKVLFTTGFSRNAIIHNGVLDPGVQFIGKPFSIEALSRKVRSVLDA